METLIFGIPISFVCSLVVVILVVYITKTQVAKVASDSQVKAVQQKLDTGPSQEQILATVSASGYDLTNSCCCKCIAFDVNGRLWGITIDNKLLYRMPTDRIWTWAQQSHMANALPVLTFDSNNVMYTVGNDNCVYMKKTNQITSDWVKTPACNVIDICWTTTDKLLYAADKGNFLKKQLQVSVVRDTWNNRKRTFFT